MLHHLPDESRRKCISEIRRVLKPGGRLLPVDFGGPADERRSLIAHFRHHINFDLRKVIPMLAEAGLNALQSGAAGFSDLQFVLAAAPSGVNPRSATQGVEATGPTSGRREMVIPLW